MHYRAERSVTAHHHLAGQARRRSCVSMRTSAFLTALLGLVCLVISGCVSQAESHENGHAEGHGEKHAEAHEEGEHHAHQIVVTSPIRKDVISTQQYVCQIHSCKHIEVRALEGGYL